jgi:alpha-mannosidase
VLSVRDRLRDRRFTDVGELSVQGSAVIDEPIHVTEAQELRYSEVRQGETFGPAGGGFAQRWFRISVPSAAPDHKARRVLFWQCQGETTLYAGAQAYAGLDVAHPYCDIPDEGGTLYLDCATYQTSIFVQHPAAALSADYGCRFDRAWLAVRDVAHWELSWDFELLCDLMELHLDDIGFSVSRGPRYQPPLSDADPLLRSLLRDLDEVCDLYDTGDLATMADRSAALLRDRYSGGTWSRARVALVGHAHIDLLWLWPERETYRKAVHTFATACRMLERYPDVRFQATQPPLYNAIRAGSPGLFQQIRAHIDAGRWEATGAMYIESDVLLSGGEGLVRALLYGQRSFEELTGSRSRVLWLPDVFGYSACLPQLLRQAGVRSFFTAKIVWSAVSRFPHTTFIWRGPDGSTVTTHLCTAGYNGRVQLDNLRSAARQNRQSAVADEVLLPTGFGDGGGGLTEEMCERARRVSDLSGIPAARWTTGEAFFDRLEEAADGLPIYEGELYLEYHRGTYTSQARLKQRYQRALSWLAAHEGLLAAHGRGSLGASKWDRVLITQFHDALPGSSIGRVYEELEAQLDEVIREHGDAVYDLLREAEQPAVYNPCAVRRLLTLAEADDRARTVTVPGHGVFALARLAPVEADPVTVGRDDGWILDNGSVAVHVRKDGAIDRLQCGEHGYELLATRFVLHDDYPAAYDAWDIDRHTPRLATRACDDLRLRVAEESSERVTLNGSCALGDASTLELTLRLRRGSEALEIECSVDWAERHKLLRYEVETRYAGRDARYGAPFGSVTRCQRPRREEEEAQWEVPASRWAAVIDDPEDEGIALVTEATFGFSCRDGLLGVSLLRSPTYPDADADQGSHRIRFAIAPYRRSNSAVSVSTASLADALYAPLPMIRSNAYVGRGVPGDARSDRSEAGTPGSVVVSVCGSRLHVGPLGSVSVSWIKPDESGRGAVIRFHESFGSRGSVLLSCPERTLSFEPVSILEERVAERDVGWSYSYAYQPYELFSIRVQPA